VTIAVPLLLTGYALAVAIIGTRWLPRWSWTLRMPRAGISAWQVLTVTFIAAALAAGLLIAIPCFTVSLDWVTAEELRQHYNSPARIAASTTAAVVTLAIIGRLAWATASAAFLAKRRRARHDYALALVGRPGPVPGTVVLDDDRPAVYCLPGRRRIVFTTGALHRLDSQQFQAVVAHERAHLAGRHHLINMLARILPSAFPGIRLLDIAAGHIGSLVEMAADDTAARHAHRLSLARALLALGTPTVQAPALGAAGTAGAQRIRRLVEARRPVSSSRRATGFALTLLATPAAALAVPALALLAAPHCEHDAADHLPAASAPAAIHLTAQQLSASRWISPRSVNLSPLSTAASSPLTFRNGLPRPGRGRAWARSDTWTRPWSTAPRRG
jgi:Zn-dependent protease with chaperone function